MLSNKLLATQKPSGVEEPEGVSFDGVTDYLSRSTDLVGNVDSKTFTFSAWVYIVDNSSNYIYVSDSNGNLRFYVRIDSTHEVRVLGKDSSDDIICNVVSSVKIPKNTYFHILISLDLSNNSMAHICVNDTLDTNLVKTTYVNSNIDFTNDLHKIGGIYDVSSPDFEGRLSHLYLDYTYRDLSIEANRRLFITEDGKPADGLGMVDKYLDNKFYVGGQKLNPTGVCFLDNGSKAFVLFDATPSLYSYTLTTPYDFKSAVYDTVAVDVQTEGSQPFSVRYYNGNIYVANAGNETIFQYSITGSDLSTLSYTGKSLDISAITLNPSDIAFNSNGSKVYILSYGNDSILEYDLSSNYDISTSSNLNITTLPDYIISPMSFKFNSDGTILSVLDQSTDKIYMFSLIGFNLSTLSYIDNIFVGDVEFLPACIDLSGDGYIMYLLGLNDSIFQYTLSTPYDISTAVYGLPANSPQQPILYLPMKDAATAHQNLGTGGDFVQNGVLDTASRGANQDNCVASEFDGVNDYLIRTVFSGGTDEKTLTFSMNIRMDMAQNIYYSLDTVAAADVYQPVRVTVLPGGELQMYARDVPYVWRFTTINSIFAVGRDLSIQVSIDTSNINNRHVYVNGIAEPVTWNVWTTDALVRYSLINGMSIGTIYQVSTKHNGTLGEVFLSKDYIDLETDNPFWDSDTNKPIPVRKAMETLGSTPLICMPIDASSAGKNYGTGGDFTLHG